MAKFQVNLKFALFDGHAPYFFFALSAYLPQVNLLFFILVVKLTYFFFYLAVWAAKLTYFFLFWPSS